MIAWLILQCLQSSLALDGGANHWQLCITDLQTTLKTWMGRSKELPEIFAIALRPVWWVAGSEQPSPPLHRAAAARLLKRSAAAHTIMFCVRISLLQAHHISQFFANHISVGRRVMTLIVMHSINTYTVIVTVLAHISLLYLSK